MHQEGGGERGATSAGRMFVQRSGGRLARTKPARAGQTEAKLVRDRDEGTPLGSQNMQPNACFSSRPVQMFRLDKEP